MSDMVPAAPPEAMLVEQQEPCHSCSSTLSTTPGPGWPMTPRAREERGSSIISMTQYLIRIIIPPTYTKNMMNPMNFLWAPNRHDISTNTCPNRAAIRYGLFTTRAPQAITIVRDAMLNPVITLQ